MSKLIAKTYTMIISRVSVWPFQLLTCEALIDILTSNILTSNLRSTYAYVQYSAWTFYTQQQQKGGGGGTHFERFSKFSIVLFWQA